MFEKVMISIIKSYKKNPYGSTRLQLIMKVTPFIDLLDLSSMIPKAGPIRAIFTLTTP